MNARVMLRYWRTILLVAEMTIRQQLMDGFIVFTVILQPIMIALLALWMMKDKGPEYAIFVVVGSGLTGLWSSLLFISGNSINWERWSGTLEALVAVPTPFEVVVFGKNLANVVQSIASMILGYAIAGWLFGYDLGIAQPFLFCVTLILAIFAFICFGLVIAPIFVMNPEVQAWQNAMEFPVFIFGGFLFPIALLPGWTTPVSYLLPPYWAAVALHATSSGGSSFNSLLFSWAMMLLFSLIDLLIASRLFKLMLYKVPRGRDPGFGVAMRTLSDNMRIFWQGTLLSYVALFHWLRPIQYIAAKLFMPMAQMLFFVFLGTYAKGPGHAAFYIIGNAIQITAVNGIFGVTMSVGGERNAGTLAYLFGTPANRMMVFFGRAFMHILDGMLGVVIAFGWGVILLGLDLSHTNLPALGLTILITTVSTCGLGLLLGCLSLVTVNVMFVNNTVYFLLLIFSGANVPVSDLPRWMQMISSALPLTRGIAAARLLISGGALRDAAPLLWGEIGIGLMYALVGYLLFAWVEVQAKKKGTLEVFKLIKLPSLPPLLFIEKEIRQPASDARQPLGFGLMDCILNDLSAILVKIRQGELWQSIWSWWQVTLAQARPP